MPKLTCDCGEEFSFTDRDMRALAGTPFTCPKCGTTRRLPKSQSSPATPGDPLAQIESLATASVFAPAPVRRRAKSNRKVIVTTLVLILGLSLYGGVQFLLKHDTGLPLVNARQLGKIATVGDTTIRVDGVRIGLLKVSHRENDELVWEQPGDKYLQISIAIENGSRTKMVKYSGWGNLLDLAKVRLEDEFGNRYTPLPVEQRLSSNVVGVHGSDAIYPMKSINDLLVFQRPVDLATELRLTMPASAFGGKGEISFKMAVPAN